MNRQQIELIKRLSDAGEGDGDREERAIGDLQITLNVSPYRSRNPRNGFYRPYQSYALDTTTNTSFGDKNSLNTSTSLNSRSYANSVDWSKCNYDGLSYTKLNHNPSFFIDQVGCTDCDADNGNIKCYNALPLLCHRKLSVNRPPYFVYNPAHDHGWSEGQIKESDAYMGCLITDRHIADLICEDQFGKGWKLASSNQGKIIVGMFGYDFANSDWSFNGPKVNVSWRFWASGNVNGGLSRYWVHSIDGTNCY